MTWNYFFTASHKTWKHSHTCYRYITYPLYVHIVELLCRTERWKEEIRICASLTLNCETVVVIWLVEDAGSRTDTINWQPFNNFILTSDHFIFVLIHPFINYVCFHSLIFSQGSSTVGFQCLLVLEFFSTIIPCVGVLIEIIEIAYNRENIWHALCFH